MPRARSRSSPAPPRRRAAPRRAALRAASGSAASFCSAMPRLMPSATSRAWAPSCRSRSMRRSSVSCTSTAPARVVSRTLDPLGELSRRPGEWTISAVHAEHESERRGSPRPARSSRRPRRPRYEDEASPEQRPRRRRGSRAARRAQSEAAARRARPGVDRERQRRGGAATRARIAVVVSAQTTSRIRSTAQRRRMHEERAPSSESLGDPAQILGASRLVASTRQPAASGRRRDSAGADPSAPAGTSSSAFCSESTCQEPMLRVVQR